MGAPVTREDSHGHVVTEEDRGMLIRKGGGETIYSMNSFLSTNIRET